MIQKINDNTKLPTDESSNKVPDNKSNQQSTHYLPQTTKKQLYSRKTSKIKPEHITCHWQFEYKERTPTCFTAN